MEPVVNGTCLLNSDGVHPDRCAALGILEQDKCFWKSWKVKSFLNLIDMLQCELLWYHCVDFSFVRVNCSVISYPLSGSKLSSFFLKLVIIPHLIFCRLYFCVIKQINPIEFSYFLKKKMLTVHTCCIVILSEIPPIRIFCISRFITPHKANMYRHTNIYTHQIVDLSGGVSFG